MSRAIVIARITLLEMLRRKDIYVLTIILAAIMGLLMSINIFGLGGIATYVKDVGLLLCWIITGMLGIVTSTRILPQEEKQRTVYALLSRPVSRLDVVIGKWLGAWISTVFAMIMIYILVTILTAVRGGTMPPLLLMQAMLLHALALAIITGIGIALSTRLNSDAAATMSAIIVLTSALIVPQIPSMLVKAEGTAGPVLTVLYWILPHFEVLDLRWRLVHSDGSLLPWSAFIQSALYAALTTSALLIAAWASYQNKSFHRDAAT